MVWFLPFSKGLTKIGELKTLWKPNHGNQKFTLYVNCLSPRRLKPIRPNIQDCRGNWGIRRTRKRVKRVRIPKLAFKKIQNQLWEDELTPKELAIQKLSCCNFGICWVGVNTKFTTWQPCHVVNFVFFKTWQLCHVVNVVFTLCHVVNFVFFTTWQLCYVVNFVFTPTQ